jgi:N-acyl-L-homoserine lactone synthetase
MYTGDLSMGSHRMDHCMTEHSASHIFDAYPLDTNTASRVEQTGTAAHSLEGRQIDNDLRLMDESYHLRYQVYCVERGFLDAADYPDRRERDEFDRYSLHLGVLDETGTLIATARLVQVGLAGLPLFRHCEIYPHETELYRETNRVVEVSRLCVSRALRLRRSCRRIDVVTALYRALYQVSKQYRFTHWVVATEHSLQRLVTGFGFPFRAIGPSVDYFGQVAPYLMNLSEFDCVILSRTHQALDSFLQGLDPVVNPVACAEFT